MKSKTKSAVCVFYMITGALLLRPDKKIMLHDIFHRYIKRILICYAVWVVLYAVLYTIMDRGDVKYFVLHLFLLPKGQTFGIYLVHLSVLDCLDHYFGFNVTICPAIVSVPLVSIVIFVISLAVTVLLKKIPGIRNTVS